MKERIEQWMFRLWYLMHTNKYIKETQKLNQSGFKPYYDEGLTPQETMVQEFGNDWNNILTPPKK